VAFSAQARFWAPRLAALSALPGWCWWPAATKGSMSGAESEIDLELSLGDYVLSAVSCRR